MADHQQIQQVERTATMAFSSAVIGKLLGEIYNQVNVYRDLSSETQDLNRSLVMLAGSMDLELIQHGGAPRTSVARAYNKEMRILTHDIEDCFERFLHRVTCKKGASHFDRAVHTLRNIPRSMRFARKVKKLKVRLENARNRVFNPPGQLSALTVSQTLTPHVATDSSVGIAEDTKSLVALLEKPNQHSVILIVGLGGSGKTTLAREVYHLCEVKFPCAWVCFSTLDSQSALGILSEIQNQLLPREKFSVSTLREYLDRQKGYLIVLDGAKMKHMVAWKTLRDTLKGCGGVLVTAAAQSVANAFTSHCSEVTSQQADGASSFCYVYNMRRLGKEDSQALALQGRCAPELLQGSATLLEKCDGHPLSLSSVANQLMCQDEPTGQFCMELSSRLGSYLEWVDSDEPNFARLRAVLFGIYAELPDHFVRTCMLYLCIFPVNRPLRRNVIIRRWCAEGYAQSHPRGDLKSGDDIFKLLVDKYVIWPVVPSRNATVKDCRLHGILHAFLMHKSASENFIKVFDEENHGLVRHLVYDSNSTDLRTTCKMDLSRTRSLTVFGNGLAAISNFLEYKIIRVLDLEECMDLNNHHVEDICKLWNLRYLSLGPNITTIPKEIANLKLLQTLDISKTEVNELPLEVVGLPCLIHLIGKFALQKPLGTDTSRNFEQLVGECVLETLTGIVADGSPGFLQLMNHMKRLKKVKVWCTYAGSDVGLNNELSTVIPQFLQNPISNGGTRCLSLDFQGVPEHTLYAFQQLNSFCLHGNKIHLSTLKLHGTMSTLPSFIPKLADLTELCLSLPRMNENVMEKLCKLNMLLYLKVTAEQIDRFIICGGAFESLRRLRFVVEQTYFILPTVLEGALPQLVSLQLFCRGLVSSGSEIRNLKNLKEVNLDSEVHANTRGTWEEEARKHPNMPHIFMV